jgi:hypothetical protein
MKYSLLFFLLMPFLFSCKKASDRTCWKGAGEVTKTSISFSDFSKLYLYENIEYELVQDSLNQIELIGGRNLLPHIQVNQTSDGTIEVKNQNTCSFLRYNATPVKVIIHFKNLTYLTFQGTRKLTNTDTLRLSNFQFFMKDGGGSIDLKLNVSNSLLGYHTHGAGDFTLGGFAQKATFNIMTLGRCDTRNLKIGSALAIVSNANSPCYVNANSTELKAEITGQGNIYYSGIPSSLSTYLNGEGKVLPY